MKKFLLAAIVVALGAADSQACVARRASRAKSVTKTKTVTKAAARPVREVLVAPLRLALPCPNCR